MSENKLCFFKGKRGQIVNLDMVDAVTPPTQNGSTKDWYFQIICNGAVISFGYDTEANIKEDYERFMEISQIENLVIGDEEEDEPLEDKALAGMLNKYIGEKVTRLSTKEVGKIKGFKDGKWYVEFPTKAGSISIFLNANELAIDEDEKKGLAEEFEKDKAEWEAAEVSPV